MNAPIRMDQQMMELAKKLSADACFAPAGAMATFSFSWAVAVADIHQEYPAITANSLTHRFYQRLPNPVATMSSNAGSPFISPISRQNAFIPVTNSGVMAAS